MKGYKEIKPWYRKRWLVLLLIFFGLAIYGSYLTNNTVTTKEGKSISRQRKSIQENKSIPLIQKEKEHLQVDKEVNEPNYRIVHEVKDMRYDGGNSFYVLVDEPDVSNSDFKNQFKKMTDQIVKDKGGQISIDFISDKDVLELVYKSHYGKNTLGRIFTKSERNKIESALIATFAGQLKTGLYLNSLDFFPATSTDNPKVGKYVESIEYDPFKHIDKN